MGNISTNQKSVANVGLIGCGNIASLWDETEGPAHQPKTHAAAFSKDPRFHLSSFFDINLKRAQQACDFWKGSLATDSFEKFLAQDLDILCLCVPEQARVSLLQQIPQDKNYVVISEKPLAPSIEEAERIFKIVQSSTWKFLINYIRRYGTGFQELKSRLVDNPIQKVVATYGKGLRNNGTHMLDLFNFLFGTPLSGQWLATVEDDRLGQDSTCDALIYYQKKDQRIPVYLIGTDHRDYTLFELEIFLKAGRIKISERGEKIELEKVIDDPQYPGYKILQSQGKLRSGLENYFSNLASEAYGLWSGQLKQGSSHVQSGLDLLKIVAAIEESKKNNGKTISLK